MVITFWTSVILFLVLIMTCTGPKDGPKTPLNLQTPNT